MNKKIHLKKKIILFNKKNKVNVFVITFILLIFALVFIFKFINKMVTPTILNYAELEARKLATLVINSAINKNISNKIKSEEIFLITKDSNNQINSIDFNPSVVNSILTETTTIIQKELKQIEDRNVENIENFDLEYISEDKKAKKGIIFEIPSGLVFNNAFFANLGPKIPIKLNLVGDITSEITTQVTNYGINNALIETSIVIDLKLQIVLPYKTEKVSFQNSIPISLKLIQGIVPNYYFNGIDKNSSSFIVPK